MIRLVFVVLLSFISLGIQAQQHFDSYRVDTLVADQSEAERITAIKATLGDIIVRITGDANSLQHPLVRQAIDNAPNYVLQFSYSDNLDKNAIDGVKLTLSYSYQAIETLLHQAQLKSTQQNAQVLLHINNVKNFVAFKQVQVYLKNISGIRHNELVSVDKDTLTFRIMIDNDISSLKANLSTADKFQLEESTSDSPSSSTQLTLRWKMDE